MLALQRGKLNVFSVHLTREVRKDRIIETLKLKSPSLIFKTSDNSKPYHLNQTSESIIFK